MPRVTLSWARAGVRADPPPAAATAIAVSNAIARAAGAMRRVLIGVPCKDIPIFCQTGREPSDALGGGQRGRPSRLGHGWAGSQAICGIRQQRGRTRGATDRKTMLEKAKQLLKPSKRSEVPPFIVMDVMAAAAQREAQGAHIIHMEVGQPAAPAPATAIKAAQAALTHGRIGYTETLGIPSLRARIARHYQDAYGVALDPARVVVTTGSSGGFILAFLSLFEPGDRVALANPGYPPYRHILSALGCEPVLIDTSAQTRWALSAKALLAAHQRKPLKGVVIASPANPTGTMIDADALSPDRKSVV